MFQVQKMGGQTGLPQLKLEMMLDYSGQTVLCGKYMAASQH
jgi:hypothetical protein